jgi:mono/diheme cytochrome c family protein
MIKPGPFGGHNWQPMSFNPQTGLVYIPALDAAFGYADEAGFKPAPGGWNLGIDLAMALGAPGTVVKPPVGFLLAWDPVAQKERWRVPHANMWNGGTLTTGGNLVFQGNGDGQFAAYRADTGARVWQMPVGSPIIAAPITYELDNTQYVAVMAGYGGAMRVAAPAPPTVPGQLLVFALGGKAKIPAAPATSMARPTPIAVPTATPDTIMLGAVTYARRCSMCHGAEAASGGLAPDLRYSQPATFDRYDPIVLGGALSKNGMPSFKGAINDAELAAIKTYVLTQRGVLTK